MRDSWYKGLVDSCTEYDAVIDWIKNNNPFIKDRTEEEREQFACNVVHSCIRAVVFGDSGTFAATGMCIAIAAGKTRKDQDGNQKVVLAIKL
jgi:hypothetical protein